MRFGRVLTDNGACYRSRVFAKVCRRLGLKHRRTRPYRPRTNGKAERLIQTALHEWRMPAPTRMRINARRICRTVCMTIAGIARTPVSITTLPSAHLASA
ncbi:integrase core domain-containing protein [Salinisphaera shabanensis]|uniref:integrase core domain-containing protein n=1 Tax=Salinisphaera shabanensis TaxID=180542 RepID=UPI003DA76AE8